MNCDNPSGSALRNLFNDFQSGKVDRRTFVTGSLAMGVGVSVVQFLANSVSVGARQATPTSDVAGATRPTAGTEKQSRGGGGALQIVQWQAPSQLSPHVSTGVKDRLAATLVCEPLIHYLPDATMIPNLIREVPSIENGLLADDFTSVLFNLLPGILWNDGQPFTSADVKATVEWVQNPETNSPSLSMFEVISDVELIDDLSCRVTFSGPNPFWYEAFAGTNWGFVYPSHVIERGENAMQEYLSFPVGTGPYRVREFNAGDSVIFEINEHYREPNKPFFSEVTLKGGGDAPSAARAVLQTGDADFAWNLQVEPEILTALAESPNNPGDLIEYPGVAVEKVNMNFSDPITEVNGQRSEVNTPNPVLSDFAVRQAISLATDRELIASEFYGLGQPPATNVLYGDPAIESPNTSWEYNMEKAASVLDEAGWVLDGDLRSKDGVELKLSLTSSVSSVRQKVQAVLKASLESIGFEIEIIAVDSSIYLDSSLGNDQNVGHFYWDMQIYTASPNSPRPLSLMQEAYAGPDNTNVAQESNGWRGRNRNRWVNAEFDAAWEAAQTETDPEALADLFILMNDLIVNDINVVPLVVTGPARGISKRLRKENIALAPFSHDYWNIANWNLDV